MADIPQRPRGPLVYRGAKEICGAVGVSYKEIAVIVRELGMPAFKIRGNWVARPESMAAWVERLEGEFNAEPQRRKGAK